MTDTACTRETHHADQATPLLYREGELTPLEDATGMPLCVEYSEFCSKKGKLKPGDVLLLYSDGVVEAHDPSDRMLTLSGLQGMAIPGLNATELGTRIVEGVRDFEEGRERRDDQTVLCVGRV